MTLADEAPSGLPSGAGQDDGAPTAAVRTAPTAVGQALLDGFGGRRGVIDSALPTVVFAIANVIGPLRTAVVLAGATGVLLAVVRAARHQPVRQALSGLVGLGFACLLALRSGQARTFYLPGVLLGWAYAAAFLGSLVVRRPLVGVVMGHVRHDAAGWRTSPPLRRAFSLATLAWGTYFAAKALLGTVLFARGQTTGLAVVRLALGYPPLLLLLALTAALTRAGQRAEQAHAGASAGTGEAQH